MDQENIAAVASEYLNVFGYMLFSYSWLIQCKEAINREDDIAKTKLKTARVFYQNVLPEREAHTNFVLNGTGVVMDFVVSEF